MSTRLAVPKGARTAGEAEGTSASAAPRLPRVEREDATLAQREVLDGLLRARGKPRGRLANLYAMMLAQPGVARVMGSVGAYVRFESSLGGLAREAAILAVCYRHGFDYEARAHEEIALTLGSGGEDIAAAVRAQRLAKMPPEAELAVEFAQALSPAEPLDAQLWQRATRQWGAPGALDLLLTCAHYTALAMVAAALQPEPDPLGAWKPTGV